MDPAISITALSKRYRINGSNPGDGLRHAINELALAPWRQVRRLAGRPSRSIPPTSTPQEFWALRDVSLDVDEGKVVGIIGRNGAGKTTLLKLVSRITAPTSGFIKLRGRVASLLEVGTGFHPELTGRENVFLNGAILGMKKVEIQRKFDEIVSFAEIGAFLDTPVKRYSTGMYTRLAFSIAAHLESEILLVDEVLAVGDVAFQRKCLGKMNSVARHEGRTVLFVSHNMAAVTQLCDRVVHLEHGQIVRQGVTSTVVGDYFAATSAHGASRHLAGVDEAGRKQPLWFCNVAVLDDEGRENAALRFDAPFRVRLEYEVPEPTSWIEMSVRLLTADGRAVLTTMQSDLAPEVVRQVRHGRYEITIPFPARFLMPGDYVINIASHEPGGGALFELHESVIRFTIEDTGSSFARYGNHQANGLVVMDLPWDERPLSNHSSIAIS
ncbi:MAG TPA: ABC transporter ATP-binding protein [Vicinamibacterales bacterium]|jgi:lipopolysaccharide transport system ATP-binding protein